jgi:hypothetical protein
MRNNNVSQNGFTKESILVLLAANDMAVVRGVEAVYARQTSDERASETTNHSNGRGFNGRDAKIGSSFAKQIKKWREADPSARYAFPLSPKQLGVARRFMTKYAAQLALVANEKAAARDAEAAAEAAAERAAIQAEEMEPVQSLQELEADRIAELEAAAIERDLDAFAEVEEYDYISLT